MVEHQYLFLICITTECCCFCAVQPTCIISPKFTALTIRDGLLRDIELHCQCTDDNEIIAGTRWFFNSSLVLTGGDTNRPTNAPYYIDTNPTTLYIDRPFNDLFHSGTYTCLPNSVLSNASPEDTITLSAASELCT